MPRGMGGGGFRGGGFRGGGHHGGGFRGGGHRRQSGSSMVSNTSSVGSAGMASPLGSPLLTGLMGGGLGYLLGSNRADKNDQQDQDQQDQQAPPAPAATPATATSRIDDGLNQLKRLGELHESGVLTDEEFALATKKIIEAER